MGWGLNGILKLRILLLRFSAELFVSRAKRLGHVSSRPAESVNHLPDIKLLHNVHFFDPNPFHKEQESGVAL